MGEHHKIPKWLQSSFEILELRKCKPLLPAVPLAFEVWVPAFATPHTSAFPTSSLELWCGLALCLGLGLHLSCFGRWLCFVTGRSLQTFGLPSTLLIFPVQQLLQSFCFEIFVSWFLPCPCHCPKSKVCLLLSLEAAEPAVQAFGPAALAV